MTTNIRICANNLVESGSLLTSIVASTAVSTMPASNLTNSIKSLPWRSTTKASEQTITVTFNASYTVSMTALMFTNLSPTATFKVALYTLAADGSAAYTSPYTAVFNTDMTGLAISPVVNTYAYGKGCFGSVYFPERSVQKIIISILDTSNTAAYLQVGNLIVGKYWTPVFNFERGQTVSITDEGKQIRNEATDLLVDAGQRYRKISFSLAGMRQADRIQCINLLRNVGITYPIFISLFPLDTDTALEALYCLQGNIDSIAALEMIQFDRYNMPFTVVEI